MRCRAGGCPSLVPVRYLYRDRQSNPRWEREELTLGNTATLTNESPSVDESLEARTGGICEPALDLALALLLQVACHTSERPSGSSRADEGGESSGEGLRLRVDFRSSRLDVSSTVTSGVAVAYDRQLSTETGARAVRTRTGSPKQRWEVAQRVAWPLQFGISVVKE